MNLSYLLVSGLMLMPWRGYSSPGISRYFMTSPSSPMPMQKKKSARGLYLLSPLKEKIPRWAETTGLPRLFFLRWIVDVLTSKVVSPLFKSAPNLLNSKCSAPSNLAALFSHMNPVPVRLLSKNSPANALGFLRTYHARFTHLYEQYLGRPMGVFLSQNRHFLFINTA